MGKMQRTKGAAYERAIVNRLKAAGFPDAYRQLEFQASQAVGVDVRAGNLKIQCKRYAKYAPIAKINEIVEAGGIHVLVTKGDRVPDMVALSLDDFLAILEDVGVAYEKE
jgi:hypothetical protein